MAKASRGTFAKRQKEMARQDRQKEKAAKRLEAKDKKAADGPAGETAEDPDIAGIRPGPQPGQFLDIDDHE